MYTMIVRVTDIEWDTTGVPPEDIPKLPASYDQLKVLIHDPFNLAEIAHAVITALQEEFDLTLNDMIIAATCVQHTRDLPPGAIRA